MNKKRIIVILQHNVHLRNFLLSGFIPKLQKQADLHLILPKRFAEAVEPGIKKDIGASFLEDFQGGRFREWSYEIARLGSIVHRRNLNNTYKRTFDSYLKGRSFKLKLLVLLGFDSFLNIERITARLVSSFRIHKNAASLVDEFKPDIIFSPTSVYETGDIEIVKAAKKKGVKIVFFVDSWDNLTSKGCFLVRPDLLMVWGEADKESALREHGFKDAEVVVTGAAHFDSYFKSDRLKGREAFLGQRGIDRAKKIILFAGTTFRKYAYEPLIIKKLSDYFLQRKDVLIWYRPHPRSIKLENLKTMEECRNIYIDDQILDCFRKNKSGFAAESSYLEHYPNLINSCIGVVSIFSTMVIEFALLKKPSVLIDFRFDKNGNEFLEKENRLSANAHLQEVLGWQGVSITESFSSLAAGVEKMIAGGFDEFSESLQRSAKRIARNTDGLAQERILNALVRGD